MLAKSKNHINLSKFLNIGTIVGATGFLTVEARVAFTHLIKTFIKAPIFQHFNSECHIRISTIIFSYSIGRVFV